MIEYQIILNVYMPAQGGSTIKRVVKGSDRDNMITKFKYLGELVTDKRRARELADWSQDNNIPGNIIGTEGLFGVSYVKII